MYGKYEHIDNTGPEGKAFLLWLDFKRNHPDFDELQDTMLDVLAENGPTTLQARLQRAAQQVKDMRAVNTDRPWEDDDDPPDMEKIMRGFGVSEDTISKYVSPTGEMKQMDSDEVDEYLFGAERTCQARQDEIDAAKNPGVELDPPASEWAAPEFACEMGGFRGVTDQASLAAWAAQFNLAVRSQTVGDAVLWLHISKSCIALMSDAHFHVFDHDCELGMEIVKAFVDQFVGLLNGGTDGVN